MVKALGAKQVVLTEKNGDDVSDRELNEDLSEEVTFKLV